jgi:hypothetical protein
MTSPSLLLSSMWAFILTLTRLAYKGSKMAISRSQQLKELLPGLNALFGLEYKKYEEEHREISKLKTPSDPSKRKPNFLALAPPPLNRKVQQLRMTMPRKLGPPATTTKPLLLVLRSLKKLLRTTSMTLSRLATPKLWPVRWQTPNRLRLLTS